MNFIFVFPILQVFMALYVYLILTLSLMAGKGMPIGVMGIILPIYAIIDMIETAVNIYSDSCVCAMVNKDLGQADEESPVA